MHYLLSMILFAMHMVYGFITNPSFFNLYIYISYHIDSDSMHPYNAFGNHSYSTNTHFW